MPFFYKSIIIKMVITMVVNMEEILLKAYRGKYAVPQFNINNLEWTRYILEECQNNNSPVILGVSEGAARYMGGFLTVASLVKSLVKDLKITIPVIIHLDHGSSVESCISAINAGFTSVMIDASKYPLEENIKITKEVIEYAHARGITVEAEIGHIGGTEDEINADIAYAKLEDCEQLVKETKVDFLAPALGSVHGLYKGEPCIDFTRMKKINESLKMPLVLHGGTGLSDDIIKEAINCGICKININTELQIEWAKAVRSFLKDDSNEYDPRKIIRSGEKEIKKAIKHKIELFGSNQKA